MEKQELISVIIPVYNVEKYLKECVDSVLKQRYQNFEVILVDDGSTDSSGKICDEYENADNRIKVIHQKNQGLSGARNTGLENAKGKYLYFLDSDDWIDENALMSLSEKAESENADVVFFDAISFTDDSNENKVKQRYLRVNEYHSDNGYKVLGELQKNKEYHSSVPLLFIKRSYIESIGIRFEPEILYEDMLFTYELFCRAERVGQLRKSLYHRRYRENSIMTSRKKIKNFSSAKAVYEKVRNVSESIEKTDESTAQEYISRCAFNALNYYKKLVINDRLECREAYSSLKEDILKNKAYGNKSLFMRCYGTFPWFCYKVVERIFPSVLKG